MNRLSKRDVIVRTSYIKVAFQWREFAAVATKGVGYIGRSPMQCAAMFWNVNPLDKVVIGRGNANQGKVSSWKVEITYINRERLRLKNVIQFSVSDLISIFKVRHIYNEIGRPNFGLGAHDYDYVLSQTVSRLEVSK